MCFSFHIVLRLVVCLLLVAALPAAAQPSNSILSRYLTDIAPADLVEGAYAWGAIRQDVPVASVLSDGEEIGFVFVTSDFVGTTGYSGKPIHTMVAIDDDARVLGVDLVKHSEPIVLIGIPDRKIRDMAAGYRGVDLVAEAAERGSAHDLNIISGATVTVMVIDDGIIRAGLKVARALGLGGLTAEVDETATAPDSWMEMEGDGTIPSSPGVWRAAMASPVRVSRSSRSGFGTPPAGMRTTRRLWRCSTAMCRSCPRRTRACRRRCRRGSTRSTMTR
ncbi:FMN-binding protein [Halovulum sp. GXIMD14794]